MRTKIIFTLIAIPTSLFLLAFSHMNAVTQSDPFVIVLDAGHGGKDPGKVSNGINEKDIALKVVMLIGKELEQHKDIKVVYTRKDDRFVDLYVRGRIANKAKADLFVSVHCNAHHTEASGAETYVLGLHANKQNFEVAKAENEVIYLEDDYEQKYAGYDINSPESVIGFTIMQEEYLDQSIQLAKMIQQNFTDKMKRKNRGVKQAGFIVLHQTYMPSVLIETGFVTNREERLFLTSSKGQEQFADNIAKAILDYKKLIRPASTAVVTSKEVVQEKKPAPVKEEEKKSVVKQINTSVIFKVQIAAGAKKVEALPQNFKGLKPVSIESSGTVYRYFYGETNSYDEVKQLQKEAVEKGYKDAFIVAYKKGVEFRWMKH